MSIYFTSDLHFFHNNVIKYNQRPYQNTNEMNEKLIQNWNNKVGKKDEIYCLGDFGFHITPEKLKELGSRLNGHKHLIVGNHDKIQFHVKSQIWDSVNLYRKIKINGYKVILCHYPIFDFDGAFHNNIHLFGHIHDKNELNQIYDFYKIYNFHAYCVRVDFNNYAPISFDEILQLKGLNNDKI